MWWWWWWWWWLLFFGGGGLDWHRISFFSFSLIRKSVRSRTCEKKWMGSYCWRKISCTSWYGSSTIIYEFYTCQMVQDFFHQQYGQHLLCIGCNYRPYKTGASPTQYFVSWTEFQNVLNVYFYKGWFPNIQGKGIVDPKTWIIAILNLAKSVVWLLFWVWWGWGGVIFWALKSYLPNSLHVSMTGCPYEILQ